MSNTLMTPDATDTLTAGQNIVPGADTLGFSINLATAASWVDAVHRVVLLNTSAGTEVEKFGKTYVLPGNVSLNDRVNSNIDFSTFSSKKEYSNQMAAQSSVDASGWGFTGKFNASYASISEGTEVAAYGLVEAHSNLWDAKLQTIQGVALEANFSRELAALPTTFNATTQAAFFDFFNKYGTHIITTAFVGGQINYQVVVKASSSYNKQTAKAQMALEYESVFASASATGKASWSNMDKSWLASRNAKLSVVGGDPSILTKALPPTNPDQPVNYNDLVTAWAKGVGASPSVTGAVLQPLSKVAPATMWYTLDTALAAYLNASVSAECSVKYAGSTTSYPIMQEVGYAMLLGQTRVTMPVVPTPQQLSNCWIVLADGRGSVVFNQNVVSDNSADFDTLVKAAQAASTSGTYWAMMTISNNRVSHLNLDSKAWLRACGINTDSWTTIESYHNAPFQLVAVGKTNNPSFPGTSAFFNFRAAPAYSHLVELKAEKPLFISMLTPKA